MLRRIKRRVLACEPADGLETVTAVTRLECRPHPPAGGGAFDIIVRQGQPVTCGELLARHRSASVHAAASGVVVEVGESHVVVHPKSGWDISSVSARPVQDLSDLPAFLARMGVVGMGGGRFPTSMKVKASKGAHTLVINGCECEPGVTIDQALLLTQSEWVKAGAAALAEAVGATRTVLAIRNDRKLVAALKALYTYEVLVMPDRYPAGAERLILKQLTGRMPAVGVFPYQCGCIIQNVATLRAVGRAVQTGLPLVERPLSLIIEPAGYSRNLLVPVGMMFGQLLEHAGWEPGPDTLLIAGGLMMGAEARLDTPVDKGTTSVFVLDRRSAWLRERECVRCGACYDACPLGLHPIHLAEHLATGRLSRSTVGQLKECFLCGCCSAVCPSGIPIAQRLREARAAGMHVTHTTGGGR